MVLAGTVLLSLLHVFMLQLWTSDSQGECADEQQQEQQ